MQYCRDTFFKIGIDDVILDQKYQQKSYQWKAKIKNRGGIFGKSPLA